MQKHIIATILLTFIGSQSAKADWLYNKQEDPFQGDSHLAMAIDPETGYGAGFRCVSGKDTELTLIFATPERIPSDSTTLIGAMPMKLLVIIDDKPKVELEGAADTVGDANLLRIQSTDTDVNNLLKSAMVAKRRFAVALEMMGKIVHSHTFDLRGAKRAIGKAAAACNLAQ